MATTEEVIEIMDGQLNALLATKVHDPVGIAIACELRALRLMLKDELRELGWTLRTGSVPDGYGDALASRKAPDA